MVPGLGCTGLEEVESLPDGIGVEPGLVAAGEPGAGVATRAAGLGEAELDRTRTRLL